MALGLRGCLTVLIALPRVATQSAEGTAYDATIASLCAAPQEGGATISLTQTGPHEVRVTTSAGNIAAVWLRDEYGDVLGLQQSAGSTTTLSFGDVWCTDGQDRWWCGNQPGSFSAHAYYNVAGTGSASTCQHAESARVLSWSAKVQAYLTSDTSQDFGDPNDLYGRTNEGRLSWSGAELTAATPTFDGRVDYAAKRATPAFTLPNNMRTALAYVTGSDGLVLGFLDSLTCSTSTCTQELPVALPPYEGSLHACTALCVASSTVYTDTCALTERRCTSFSLLTLLRDELEGIALAGRVSGSFPVSWPSASTLEVDAPTQGTSCGSPPSDYVLYTRGIGDGSLTLAHTKPLVLPLSTTACDYTAAQTTCGLDVSVVCGASGAAAQRTRYTFQVDLTATHAALSGEVTVNQLGE